MPSFRYVDRIVESLEQKLKISKNLLHQVEALQQRHKNAVELQLETEPKHENLVKKTKVLQKQVCVLFWQCLHFNGTKPAI